MKYKSEYLAAKKESKLNWELALMWHEELCNANRTKDILIECIDKDKLQDALVELSKRRSDQWEESSKTPKKK